MSGRVRSAVFFAVAIDEKFPDFVKPGDFLLGNVSYGEPAPGSAGKHSRGGFTVQYHVTAPAPAPDTKADAADADDGAESETPAAEKLALAVRDAKLQYLQTELRKWPTREDHAALLKELLASYPEHLPLLQERITAAEEIKDPDPEEAKAEEPARIQRVLEAADALLATIDLDGLAAFLGRRTDPEDKTAVRQGKEWELRKDSKDGSRGVFCKGV